MNHDSSTAELLRRKLTTHIEQIVSDIDGVMGVAIKDLTSGAEILLNADLTFPTGSTIKIPVLIALYKQVAEGRYSLSEQRRILLKDEVESIVLQYFGDGTSSLSLRDLAVLMIRHSDNIATNLLIDQVGGLGYINALLEQFGLAQIRLQRKTGDRKASARGDENIATLREALKMLEMLHRGEIVSAALCEDVLAVMKLPKGNHSPMTAALPEGVVIASKTGTLDGVKNEWAIVYPPRRPFIVAIAANYLGEDACPAIGKITRLAYDYFSRVGRSTHYGVLAPLE